MKIKERNHNMETGEIIEFERDMTEQEIKEMEIFQAHLAEKAALDKKAAEAKAALLDKLGITEEEAKLLLS